MICGPGEGALDGWTRKVHVCEARGHCNWILEGKNLHFFKQRLTGKPLLSEPT